ncbi:MAG TPA: ABC transporter permease, partial [Candidatus Dormibacteraeota bacterium]|nr:ABC transporter permease [Candidatus Dormibacteraeota bacterium]
MSSRAEPLAPGATESWAAEWARLTAFAYRNLIMARRNVFFLFELTFWPGVAMLSHGLLTRFLDLTPEMTAFILVGTVALSAVQVCQLDVAYAVLFDIWSKSMKHQFLTPVRIHHLALGSWLVGVGRGVIVWALMAVIGGRAFGFDFLGPGPLRVALFLLGCFLTALVIGLLVCALVLLFGTRAETSAWAAVNFFVMLGGIYYPISV